MPFKHELHSFPSGLRLVTIPMEGTKTATVFVLVGTGSKYETKDINGISHFLEHMIFKGTAKRPGPMDIARELDSIGASYNAFTSKEYTGYHAKASAKKLDVIMDVVFDIFLNSKIDAAVMEVERGPIIEELRLRANDDPQQMIGRIFEQLLYGDQPAGWEIGGEESTVMKMQRDDLAKYFHSHYIAQNTVIGIAGAIDPIEIKEKVESYFKDIRQADKVTKLAVVESQTSPQVLLHTKDTQQVYVNLGLRAYHMYDERKYPLSLLASILGGGMSSRLFDEVREKRGLAYYVYAAQQPYTDTGYLEIGAGLNKEKITEGISVILQELKKIRDNGVTAEELQKVKDRVEGSMALSLEHSDNVAATYAESVLFENKVLTPEEELDKIKKVTLEDIQKVAAEVIRNDRLNLALVGPFKDPKMFQDILTL